MDQNASLVSYFSYTKSNKTDSIASYEGPLNPTNLTVQFESDQHMYSNPEIVNSTWLSTCNSGSTFTIMPQDLQRGHCELVTSDQEIFQDGFTITNIFNGRCINIEGYYFETSKDFLFYSKRYLTKETTFCCRQNIWGYSDETKPCAFN
ncbi:hypothetical protein MXB_4016 [Myxobolus squamalis]|nr:hypothetical protein MXB_4016 [Myxobolus squamalis]